MTRELYQRGGVNEKLSPQMDLQYYAGFRTAQTYSDVLGFQLQTLN